MIGHLIDVEADQFDYIFGLLMDEGLVPDEHFMPVGAANLVVMTDAWAGLNGEVQQEVARFARPSSEIVVRPAEPSPDVAVTQPAGQGDNGPGVPAEGAESPTQDTRPTKTPSKGAH